MRGQGRRKNAWRARQRTRSAVARRLNTVSTHGESESQSMRVLCVPCATGANAAETKLAANATLIAVPAFVAENLEVLV